MQRELEALSLALENPERPVAAVVGGAKISTKLDLLGNMIGRVQLLVVGGAMANTFLAAQGVAVGRSLQEADMHATARDILARAQASGCEIVLPVDAVVATEFRAGAASRVVPVGEVPADAMILDAGPETVRALVARLPGIRTVVWNGPLGAFEIPPFDAATVALARAVATATEAGTLRSVAGGGGHGVGAAARGGGGSVLLRVERRRGVPRMAGGQDAAGYPGAGLARRHCAAGLSFLRGR